MKNLVDTRVELIVMLRDRRTFGLLFQRIEANGGNFLIIGADGGMPCGHMGTSRPFVHIARAVVQQAGGRVTVHWRTALRTAVFFFSFYS